MPVTVVIGGQYGSEGKGKVAHELARLLGASIAIRVGGPNSGHTVVDSKGHSQILRQLPTAAFLQDVICLLPPGSYVDPHVLREEIERTGLGPDRLIIDRKATAIDEADIKEEELLDLKTGIGSTGTGVGAALIRRIRRQSRTILAGEHPALRPYTRDTSALLRAHLARRERIIVEGTQGFGLSLLHSPYYPFVTARDTTAAAFIAEAGLSPLDVDDVTLVIRAFPIRVSGKSGPLPKEIDWKRLTDESKSPTPIIERTSVSKSVRRVARFSHEIVGKAIEANQPSRIVLNHLDYVDASAAWEPCDSIPITQFVLEVERLLKMPLAYLGFGPASLAPRTSLPTAMVIA